MGWVPSMEGSRRGHTIGCGAACPMKRCLCPCLSFCLLQCLFVISQKPSWQLIILKQQQQQQPNQTKTKNIIPPNTITLRKHVQSKSLLPPQGASISDCAQGQSKIRDRGCKGGGRLGGRGSSSWQSDGCGREEAPWSTRS